VTTNLNHLYMYRQSLTTGVHWKTGKLNRKKVFCFSYLEGYLNICFNDLSDWFPMCCSIF